MNNRSLRFLLPLSAALLALPASLQAIPRQEWAEQEMARREGGERPREARGEDRREAERDERGYERVSERGERRYERERDERGYRPGGERYERERDERRYYYREYGAPAYRGDYWRDRDDWIDDNYRRRYYYRPYWNYFGLGFLFAPPAPVVVPQTTVIEQPVVVPAPSATTWDRAVQVELQRLGYYRGAIDGVIGPASRAAIRDYQHGAGLPVTGVIDEALLRSLGLLR